jgi:hypothetical protein
VGCEESEEVWQEGRGESKEAFHVLRKNNKECSLLTLIVMNHQCEYTKNSSEMIRPMGKKTKQ